MKLFDLLVVGLVLICVCIELGEVEGEDELRLPKFAVPRHYGLRLQPDFVNLKFNGSVEIEVEIVKKTERLILNALDLVVLNKSVYFHTENKRTIMPAKMEIDAPSQRLVLEFPEELPVGVGVLGMEFLGDVGSGMEGLFNSTYTINGEERNMLATQFESIFARRCFPCWDEPAFKATFTVTLVVPSHLTALSNMPVIDEKTSERLKTVYFHKSPLMSTYLVAFVIGQFDHLEGYTSDGIKVGVYCPIGRKSEGAFTLEFGVKALDFYKQYLSMPFALPKLDMIAIPDFPGGMENYGLVIIGEREILINNQSSVVEAQQRVTECVAHELAHQWFGNLVTTEWWSDIWLNEAFATWLSYKAVESIYPKSDVWFRFVTHTESTLLQDASAYTHPVVVKINYTSDIDSFFDDIVYIKGAHIIRMLNAYLGPETFQRSLKVYIKKYAWSNTRTDNLWNILEEVSCLPVKSVMGSWLKTTGFPVISVNVNLNILKLSQSSSGVLNGDHQWDVPIRFCCGAYDTCHNIILKQKNESFDLRKFEGCSCSYRTGRNVTCPWIKVNANRTGYYRVVYEEFLVSDLRRAVSSKQLSTIDRYALLTDSYQLNKVPQQTLTYLLSLMSAYGEEDNNDIQNQFITRSSDIVKITYDAAPQQVGCIKKIFIDVLENYFKNIGWKAKQDESNKDISFRMNLLNTLALMGHKRTQSEAKRRFHAFLQNINTSLFPFDIRQAAYTAIMQTVKSSKSSYYKSLLKILADSNNNDRENNNKIQGSLTSSPAPSIVLESLNILFSSKMLKKLGPPDDLIISRGGREVAWTWFKEKLGTLEVDMIMYLHNILDQFASTEKAVEVKDFFAHHQLHEAYKKFLEETIGKIFMRAQWVKNIQRE